MSAFRASGIVASSFVAGCLLLAALVAPQAWEPVAEPVAAPPEPVPFATEAAVEAAIAISMRAVEGVEPAAEPERRPPVRLASRPDIDVTSVLPPAEAEENTVREMAVRSRAAELRSAPPPTTPLQVEPPRAEPPPVAPLPVEPSPVAPPLVASRPVEPSPPPPAAASRPSRPLGAPPLPGEAWNDPDSVNWTNVPAGDRATRETARESDRGGDRPLGRLREYRTARQQERAEARVARRDDGATTNPREPHERVSPGDLRWPVPTSVVANIETIAKAAAAAGPPAARRSAWVSESAALLDAVLATEGPRDERAVAALVGLGESVRAGLAVADEEVEPTTAAATRRLALSLARRVAIWRAASGLFLADRSSNDSPQDLATAEYSTVALLDAMERFEEEDGPADAAIIAASASQLTSLELPAAHTVAREVEEHYRAANVRIAFQREFIDRLLPEPVESSGPVDEMILGRRVRGTRTVARATGVRLSPDPESVHLVLEVRGAIDSRTLTSAGPVEVQSRASSTFQVQKAVRLSATGLEVGDAQAAAENRSRRDSLSTSFDAVPIMRSVVRSIARSQHADSVPEANREVLNRITERARKQVEAESTPRLATLEASVRERLWGPLVSLGLEPTPLGLETSEEAVSIRLRLAGANQIAAHTPRPSPPAEALLAMQAHESSINNAIAGLGIGGQRLSLAELGERIAGRLGLTLEEAMADDVFVTFAASEPARIQAADGLVRIQLAIECLDSPRRTWHDIVAKVAYRPVVEGMQVFLEREGPVQLSGAGQRGRLELALRAIFSAVFPKERPIAILPDRIVENRRMDGLRAVQAEADDGWLAIAIGAPAGTAADATAAGGRAGPALRGGAETGSMPPAGSSRDLPRRRAEILSRVRRF